MDLTHAATYRIACIAWQLGQIASGSTEYGEGEDLAETRDGLWRAADRERARLAALGLDDDAIELGYVEGYEQGLAVAA
jgi:hypothetical protein